VVTADQQQQTWLMPEPLRERVLFDRATTASNLSGAYVLDATGHVKASQSVAAATEAGVSFADRNYVITQQRDPQTGLFFSTPYRSRLRGSALSIGLTRRINAPDGAFAGVALLGVRLDYFQQLLEHINLGQSGDVFIVMQDGTLLANKPASLGSAGANDADLPKYTILSRREAGTFTAHSGLDGVERMYTVVHVANAPLIIVVAPAVVDVLAAWCRRS